MNPTEEFLKLVTDNFDDRGGYIPRENLTEAQIKELKQINKEYKDFYGIDLIHFDNS